MLEWRLEAYGRWLTMTEPKWARVHYPKIDYQDLYYYSAPKPKKTIGSLDEVDPEILKNFEKTGISPPGNQGLEGGVRPEEALPEHPDFVKKSRGTVVPTSDNFFATLNSAVFSDGSFVYVPPGVRCPM